MLAVCVFCHSLTHCGWRQQRRRDQLRLVAGSTGIAAHLSRQLRVSASAHCHMHGPKCPDSEGRGGGGHESKRVSAACRCSGTMHTTNLIWHRQGTAIITKAMVHTRFDLCHGVLCCVCTYVGWNEGTAPPAPPQLHGGVGGLVCSLSVLASDKKARLRSEKPVLRWCVQQQVSQWSMQPTLRCCCR